MFKFWRLETVRKPNDKFKLPTTVAKITQRSNKIIFFVVSYHHPNQTSDAFEAYFSSMNNIIERIANEKTRAIVLTGDINARSTNFCENDTDTREGPSPMWKYCLTRNASQNI